MLICRILRKLEKICRHRDEDEESDVESENDSNCCCRHNQDNNVAVQGVIEVQNNNNDNNDNNDNNNDCNFTNNQNEQVCIRANISPNVNNRGRTGTFRGCYRRR